MASVGGIQKTAIRRNMNIRRRIFSFKIFGQHIHTLDLFECSCILIDFQYGYSRRQLLSGISKPAAGMKGKMPRARTGCAFKRFGSYKKSSCRVGLINHDSVQAEIGSINEFPVCRRYGRMQMRVGLPGWMNTASLMLNYIGRFLDSAILPDRIHCQISCCVIGYIDEPPKRVSTYMSRPPAFHRLLIDQS